MESSVEIPENFKLAYDRSAIVKSISAIAPEISAWAAECHKKTGQQVLAVCILRGGLFFFADLLQSIKTSVEPACCRTWSYSSDENAKTDGGVRVSVDDVAAQGRSILMVDDICDTGATLHKLQKVFLDLGAAEVRSAVLIHREVSNSVFTPSWSAFRYSGDEWFVGYGMEDRNHYANLPGVYTIRP